MKALIFTAAFLLCSAIPMMPASAQKMSEVVVLSSRVGEIIDQSERTLYHLFPNDKGFISATFFRVDDTSFYASIKVAGPDGISTEIKRDYSVATLLRMAEIVNHREDIVAGNYILGKDPATIQVVGGPSIGWSQVRSNTVRQIETQKVRDDDGSPAMSFSPSVEFRFSGGYGFPKGGAPMSAYDRTTRSGSSLNGSTVTMNNVDDKYPTAGEGIRFEAGLVYYLDENVGLFVESGHSSGSESVNSTETDVYTQPTYTGYTQRYLSSRSIDFGYIPLVLGLHFRSTIGKLKSFAGVGAGLFFPTNIVLEINSSTNADNYEEEMKLTTNTPIGYEGYVGVDVALTPTIALFVEAKASLVSFYVTRTEITKLTSDGVDQLGSLTMSDKVTEYAADDNYTLNDANLAGQPYRGGAPIPLAANSAGVTVGFSIGF